MSNGMNMRTCFFNFVYWPQWVSIIKALEEVFMYHISYRQRSYLFNSIFAYFNFIDRVLPEREKKRKK